MATVGITELNQPNDEELLEDSVSESEYVNSVNADSIRGTLEVYFDENSDEDVDAMVDEVIEQITNAGYTIVTRRAFFDQSGELIYNTKK